MEKQNSIKVGNYYLKKNIIEARQRTYNLELMGSDTLTPEQILNKLTRDVPEEIKSDVKRLISRGI